SLPEGRDLDHRGSRLRHPRDQGADPGARRRDLHRAAPLRQHAARPRVQEHPALRGEGPAGAQAMIRRVAALGVLLILVGSVTAVAQAPPVKIGLLLPYTGPLSVQGNDTTHGIELFLKKSGARAGGRAIEILKEDTEAKPDVALTKIKKLVERDRVDFLVGPVSSVVAVAIRNYVHEQQTPLVVPVAFTRVLTSPQQASPSIFRLAETTDQSNYP